MAQQDTAVRFAAGAGVALYAPGGSGAAVISLLAARAGRAAVICLGRPKQGAGPGSDG